MSIIDISRNQKRNLKLAPPEKTKKVRVVYLNVKYLEEYSNNRTKVNFTDGTYLILNKPLDEANKDMINFISSIKK